MRILVSGASGFIGKELVKFLEEEGHTVVRIVRDSSLREKNSLYLNFRSLPADIAPFEGFSALIHLAGEPIGKGRWTKKKKRKILASRTGTTIFLTRLFAQLAHPPKLFCTASALGYYGNCGDQSVTEESSQGSGFLASVCGEWEESAKMASERGVRLVSMRFGMVLGKEGGTLARLTPIFRLGLGGKLGSGEQYVSWIHIRDLTRAIHFLLHTQEIDGPVNVCTPYPLKQKEFARSLAKSLHRPSFFHLPAPLLELFLGEMAKEMLLSSTRALPQTLLRNGFSFLFPTLEIALADIFKKR